MGGAEVPVEGGGVKQQSHRSDLGSPAGRSDRQQRLGKPGANQSGSGEE